MFTRPGCPGVRPGLGAGGLTGRSGPRTGARRGRPDPQGGGWTERARGRCARRVTVADYVREGE